MSHRFSPGQSVTFLASTFQASGSSGRYTIQQLLPAELGECQYTVRREKTGELRRARETQLKPLQVLAPPPQRPHALHDTANIEPDLRVIQKKNVHTHELFAFLCFRQVLRHCLSPDLGAEGAEAVQAIALRMLFAAFPLADDAGA